MIWAALVIFAGLIIVAVSVMIGSGMISSSIDAAAGTDGGLWPKSED